MQFNNLLFEMKEKNISLDNLAQALSVPQNAIIAKLCTSNGLTLDECKKIQVLFFPEKGIDFLFAEGNQHPECIKKNVSDKQGLTDNKFFNRLGISPSLLSSCERGE